MTSRRKSAEASGDPGVQPGRAEGLFDRIVSILEQARGRVVRTVNQETVAAYWMIGREIVVALQGGEARAEYGRRVIEELSSKLLARYRRGFSTTTFSARRAGNRARQTASTKRSPGHTTGP